MKVNAILNNYQYKTTINSLYSDKIINDTAIDERHHKVVWNVTDAEVLMLIRALGNKCLMTEDGRYVFKCCICSKVSIGFGNNPVPVKQFGFCCDNCNTNKVIPARIAAYEKLTGVK